MKKFTLLVSLVFNLAAASSFAQQDGIVITFEGQTTDISGETFTITAPNNQVFDVPFHVENKTGQSHQWV
ncbi:MAG: hypothetical protein ACKO2O_07740, partial [Crocinitomicaceae bacterium]